MKRIIVRECIVLLGSLIVGFLLTWYLYYDSSYHWYDGSNDLKLLIHNMTLRSTWVRTWLGFIAPYLIIQSIRLRWRW